MILITMQITPELANSIIFVVLNIMGVFALVLILAYSVYGGEPEEE